MIIEKWDSMYIPAETKCPCCICGKTAIYVDIFTEQGICSFECAREHNARMAKFELEAEKYEDEDEDEE